jgi:hypothetical protein
MLEALGGGELGADNQAVQIAFGDEQFFLLSSEPVDDSPFQGVMAMPRNCVERLCVTERHRALGRGEIRFAVNQQNLKAAELLAVELLKLILIFHGKILLSNLVLC